MDDARTIEYPFDVENASDAYVLRLLEPGFSELFRHGYLAALFEGLGLDIDNIFNSGNLRPYSRSVSARFELHAEDEGVTLRKNYMNLADVKLEHMDLLASAESINFLKFLFNTIDGSEWVYPYDKAHAYGNLGFSLKASATRSEAPENMVVEQAGLSTYLDLDLDRIQLGELVMKNEEGRISTIYFPKKGFVQLQAALSFACSVFTLEKADIDGYPVLDPDDITYENYYFPYRVWLDVRKTELFDVARVFDKVQELLSNPSSISGEAIWNSITPILWPSQRGPFVTIAVEFPNVDGGIRKIVLTDYAALQFLF